ncbi:hypothetical protein VP01_6526g1 [Puccinia sorghi]|uniref:Uncharacterized protein n=1 Tax=Puccinia sorghi TaxID=27349 RepID=A0A0L6UGB5_9BASI|nr:hypothetical protein VP01_6526g1 [Puccinia sorghi]
MVDQDERRDYERAKRELELAPETIKSQALQIQASNTKCRKQAAVTRGTTAWRPPSFTEDAPNVKLTVEKCHFPQLRDRVNSIETDTIDLFEQYISSLEAHESQPIDSTNGGSLGKLLRSIDGIIWDSRHPSQVVRAKWQQLAEWIELMELKTVKLLKAKELQQDLEIIEIDFGEHMSSEGLINAEIKQLKDFRTLWKLYSVLAHKISGPSTSEPFFLMSELDVVELENFFFRISIVEHSFREFATDVSNVYERRGDIKDFLPDSSPLYKNMHSLSNLIVCHSLVYRNGSFRDTVRFTRADKWGLMWQDLHKTAWQNFLETHNYASRR